MALPAPRSAFTIPSLHDDLELACRIYYPRSSPKTAAKLGRSYAIIAHPYAPLGGSYDDPVVALAGSALLKNDITLGTFNFRGAHGSAGRTSWSGKAELGDYVAFYGFMLCYMNSVLAGIGHDVSESPGGHHVPELVLGGYSYGSLIASCLPPVELVSMLFQQVQEGSAESEIKLRAEQLAPDLVGFIENHHPESLDRGRPKTHAVDSPSSPSRGLAVGGYESEAASRRISRDLSRRSLDTEKIRRSIDRTRQRFLARTKSDQDINSPSATCTNPINRSPAPAIAYLLISLILPPISGFTTMFMTPTFERRETQTQKIVVKDSSPKDEKFAQHPTCLIYGTKDLFTSSKKLQKWARERESQAGSTFTAHEIAKAGHFWVEGDVDQRLQNSISSWLISLEGRTS